MPAVAIHTLGASTMSRSPTMAPTEHPSNNCGPRTRFTTWLAIRRPNIIMIQKDVRMILELSEVAARSFSRKVRIQPAVEISKAE